MFVFAMFMLLCVDVMVMSSMYSVSFNGAFGLGVSDVYMLNSVGDRTSHCGVLLWVYGVCVFSYLCVCLCCVFDRAGELFVECVCYVYG